MSRTCSELGTCQSRNPQCQGCSWQLAPGVIDGPYRRGRHWIQFRRMTLVVRAVLLLALLALLGVAADYLNLKIAVGFFIALAACIVTVIVGVCIGKLAGADHE